MTATRGGFAASVVRWQLENGRHDLPWQQVVDPYQVWLSEIMLQQTQVSTVLKYYAPFLQRFPDLESLASAELDDVLAAWSGLGYYSRARNLHRCAREVRDRCGGCWPRTANDLQALPGIGRSTAAAISSFCFGERVAILDGNVRRVLARVLGFDSDLSNASNLRRLWALAEDLLPVRRLSVEMPAYTQGLMDLGAMVCSVRSPKCDACPVSGRCLAFRSGKPEAFPVKARKIERRSESIWLLWATRSDGAVWLVRRPEAGIWAGLYCLPVFSSLEMLHGAIPPNISRAAEVLPAISHALTHKELVMHPVRVAAAFSGLERAGSGVWADREKLAKLGMPAPIRRILSSAHGSLDSVNGCTGHPVPDDASRSSTSG